jgi:site-specific DNA-methyltransferase (adenine-specific)
MESLNAIANGARKAAPTSTVGRAKPVTIAEPPTSSVWRSESVEVSLGNSLDYYDAWPAPDVIVSDGGYGVLGFEGDTSDHLDLPQWYEPHVAVWSRRAKPSTTLWFWNSEIGWAAVHPILEKLGWRYVNCNIWNKGMGHIAGNINTQKIRRLPVVTELCVQYVFEARIDRKPLKHWLLYEWKRSGLALRRANEACGVRDAAVRKYLDQGHLWYFPPPEAFEKLAAYANAHGKSEGRPYFSLDGLRPMTGAEWASFRSVFHCPHGVTNVWDRGPVRGKERIKVGSRAVHLNQKPLDLTRRIIEASSDPGAMVWEPFGGLFTTCVAAHQTGRMARGGEIDRTYFHYGSRRVAGEIAQSRLAYA